MTFFVLFLLSTIGLTNILVHGRILEIIGLRPWARDVLKDYEADSMLDCYECMGFWSGLINGAIWWSLCGWFTPWVVPLVALASGWIGSVVSQTYTDLMYILRSKIEFVVGEEDEKAS